MCTTSSELRAAVQAAYRLETACSEACLAKTGLPDMPTQTGETYQKQHIKASLRATTIRLGSPTDRIPIRIDRCFPASPSRVTTTLRTEQTDHFFVMSAPLWLAQVLDQAVTSSPMRVASAKCMLLTMTFLSAARHLRRSRFSRTWCLRSSIGSSPSTLITGQ